MEILHMSYTADFTLVESTASKDSEKVDKRWAPECLKFVSNKLPTQTNLTNQIIWNDEDLSIRESVESVHPNQKSENLPREARPLGHS